MCGSENDLGGMVVKALVLGGTSFVGLALVRRLLDANADVTIATRARNGDPFGDLVTRRVIERSDATSLAALAAHTTWDVIYDQICYSAEDAAAACSAFDGRVGRYVFTSSIVVYEPGANLVESDFDPLSYPLRAEPLPSGSGARQYAEGKRRAEATFFRRATFAVAAARFPNILGANDPSRRLDWHIDFVKRREPIFVRDRMVRQSLVWSEDAARFLSWLGTETFSGAINGASREWVSVGDLIELVGRELEISSVEATRRTDENQSPFGFSSDFTISTALAERLGFQFTSVGEWLPRVIREQIDQGPRRARNASLHGLLARLHRKEALDDEDLDLLERKIADLSRDEH